MMAFSFRLLRMFGPAGGSARHMNDILFLVGQESRKPFLHLECGANESLFDVNRRFAALVVKKKAGNECHESSGGHSWDRWQNELPALLDPLRSI